MAARGASGCRSTVYPLVFFDALRIKVRDEGLVRNKSVHIALGGGEAERSLPHPDRRPASLKAVLALLT